MGRRGVAVADDGRFIAYVVNENGISRLRLIDPATRRVRDAHLPNGIISGLSIAPWGQIAFTLASATSPGDAFVLDPSTMAVTQWTHSETGSLDPRINYMCYASAIRFAGRFRAAQCTVAISNFVTFLENTQSYRRDLRRVEYGDERDPAQREKLIEISPMSRVK